MNLRTTILGIALVATVPALATPSRAGNEPAAASGKTSRVTASPIRHVVVLDQENHSFDNVLGKLCVLDARCDGTTQGTLSNGQVITLPAASDISPEVAHDHGAQVTAIDGGAMDGFSNLSRCGANNGYLCYQQFDPTQIPNLAALARAFVISDHSFEGDLASSWGSHLELVAATLDGFYGDNPLGPKGPVPGAGCNDVGSDALWNPPNGPPPVLEPACVPFPDGSGAYRPTPVPWVPTIMDRLNRAGLSWRLDVGQKDTPKGYGWPVCPTFADCVLTSEHRNVFPAERVITDAQAGTLPAFTLVTPSVPNSQHNGRSMLAGDNWIASVASAIEDGPQWASTVLFITYDDCGCFYDHLPPPPGMGIRVPMVIVSPYAKPGFTDSHVASFDSILAFTEHTFGLRPLGPNDANAYDYAGAFDYGQAPRAPVMLHSHRVPTWERAWLARQPREPDDAT